MACQAWSEGQTTVPSSAGVSSCIAEDAFILGNRKYNSKWLKQYYLTKKEPDREALGLGGQEVQWP